MGAGDACGGEDSESDAESPDSGYLPQTTAGVCEDGHAHGADSEDHDKHGADALCDALVQEGGGAGVNCSLSMSLSIACDIGEETPVQIGTGLGLEVIGLEVVGRHEDVVLLEGGDVVADDH